MDWLIFGIGAGSFIVGWISGWCERKRYERRPR